MDKNVSHPSHYNSGKIEVIEAIEDWDLNFHRGNAVKYVARAGRKDPMKEVEDLKKAVWYLQREIETIDAMNENREPIKPNDMNPRVTIPNAVEPIENECTSGDILSTLGNGSPIQTLWDFSLRMAVVIYNDGKDFKFARYPNVPLHNAASPTSPQVTDDEFKTFIGGFMNLVEGLAKGDEANGAAE